MVRIYPMKYPTFKSWAKEHAPHALRKDCDDNSFFIAHEEWESDCREEYEQAMARRSRDFVRLSVAALLILTLIIALFWAATPKH